jgi:hypothetical protein
MNSTRPDLWAVCLDVIERTLDEPEDLAALIHFMRDGLEPYTQARDHVRGLAKAIDHHANKLREEKAAHHTEEETEGVRRYLNPKELN